MVMLQRRHEISFFHWSCDPAILKPRIPEGITLDTFDGKAWISLTPFLLCGLCPPLVPRLLGLDFPEMNLRTYVVGAEGPGIWFFSLDAARRIAVALPGRAMACEVQHAPWDLAQVRILQFEENVRRAMGVEFPSKDFVAHFSTGVDARIGRRTRCIM